jgi:hypothetical protein
MPESFCGLRKFFDGPELWDAGIYSRQARPELRRRDAKNAKLKEFFLGGLCPSTVLRVVSLSNHAFARNNPRRTGAPSAPYENLRVLRAFVVKCLFLLWLRLCRAGIFVVNKIKVIVPGYPHGNLKSRK